MFKNKKSIQAKIIENKSRIRRSEIKLRKGCNNPSEVRNLIINLKLEIRNLERMEEII